MLQCVGAAPLEKLSDIAEATREETGEESEESTLLYLNQRWMLPNSLGMHSEGLCSRKSVSGCARVRQQQT
ncbi:hypothetical protein TgHK011_004621 [Trichoderma gracile]|nr:hypothetical protein TgHK011_004621 [Trichoderma gracile]